MRYTSVRIFLEQRLDPNTDIGRPEAALYKRVLDSALADPSFPSGSEGTYIAENGSFAQIAAARARARALHSAGKSESAEPSTLSKEEIAQMGPMGDMVGSSQSCLLEDHTLMCGLFAACPRQWPERALQERTWP